MLESKTKLQAAREKAGYTQARLATKVGITRRQLIRLEGGTSKPGLDTAQALSKVLNMAIDELF